MPSLLFCLRRLLAHCCLLCFAATVAAEPGTTGSDHDYDIVILSGSEAGFTTAIQAARMDKTVALIEPTGHPGGMAVEGIAKDIRFRNQYTIGGITKEFFQRVAAHYGQPDPFDNLEAWELRYEPSVGSEVAEAMLADCGDGITVYRHQRLREGSSGVVKEGTRLTAVILEDGTRLTGDVFIDASIEGHLLHFAGVSTATGREGNAVYGETMNGIRAESHHRNFTRKVDPYLKPGDPTSGLIPTIQDEALGTPGEPDEHIMGFCYRLCLTREPDNRVPIEKPANYLPETYEIYRRYFAVGGELFSPRASLPGGKTDLGSWHDLSANLYGENAGYPAGSYAEQDAIVQHHEDFTRGLIWFMQNDPAVPDAERAKWEGWGLCADEFTDNDHWPRRLYIRSARRMVSDFVHTERHTQWPDPEPVADPVSLAWWPPDLHHARRVVRDGVAYNEGFVFGDGGWSPFGISYRSLVPRAEEATNLLTPTCPSSSYVAYGAIRIVCTFMMLGQATGTAAALTVENNEDAATASVQSLPYPVLRERLKQDGLILEIPKDVDWGGQRDIHHGR